MMSQTDQFQMLRATHLTGTEVVNLEGESLGKLEEIMIDVPSGRVGYAVLSFGGFLGMGDRHYPLPWSQLTYDERLGGYRVDITERDLERAPSHRAGSSPAYDGGYGRDIWSYYGSF